MKEDILSLGKKNVNEVRDINRDLTEKALRMRCQSYLSKIKEKLLVQTIFEIDNSKKSLERLTDNIRSQRDTIAKQKKQLEEKNRQLEELKQDLERRVEERTTELLEVNAELRQEIAERQRAEEEKQKYREHFLQAQKMESVGRLAGGVAHDFNNLLTAILGYSRLALQKLPPEHQLNKHLNIILEAGEKGAALNRQLLALSRKQVLQMKVVDVNAMVENLARILARIVGDDLEVCIHTSKDTCNIMADIGQLEHVLLNLSVNARDAMPKGGLLTIETAAVTLDGIYKEKHQEIPPGDYTMLAVSDTGTGMPPEIAAKIFEPFFTTKERGKGTGLGLATVHGIVSQHNGHIFVYSEPGQGTTFKCYFPVTDKAPEEKKAVKKSTMPRGSETVLVVDDEETIRHLVKDTLTPLGYRVIEARRGSEALEISRDASHGVDLLITDVIMQGMNGKELRDRYIEEFPGSRVILMSGYTGTIIAQHGIVVPGSAFIQKPFSPTQLAEQVRLVLDRE